MKEQIQLFWQQREPRERMILMVGGIVLVIALLIALVWDPILAERKRMSRMVPRMQQDLVELKSVVESVKGAPSKVSQQPVQTAVDTALRAAGMTDIQVTGNASQANVVIKQTTFEAMTTALGRLYSEQGIEVTTLQVDALQEPGQIKAQLMAARR
ncbi:type II secretion system protein GspM [Chitinivorax sp. B]|uniref:type II secretion system protein GspM n=1 Tax=Chitinivorax sp. B TaxID=2502235 RepID=UPI0010F6C3CD|nr:type II secretion system protein GspM [Chitinivorax sp. B]